MSDTALPFAPDTLSATPQSAVGQGTDARVKIKLLVRAKTVRLDAWDAAIADFDGVNEFAMVEFAAKRWPTVRLEPLLFVNGEEPVAAALVMIQNLPFKLGSIAVIKSGPFLRHENGPDKAAVIGQTMEYLVAEYADRRGMMLSLVPKAPRGPGDGFMAYLQSRGFKPGSQLLFPNRYLVNLTLDLDRQRKSLHQKWRYHLNKSEKNGLSFEYAGPEKLDMFDALYQSMADRKRFPDYSAYETVPGLMNCPVEALRPALFFVHKDGEPVAGAIIYVAGKTAVYLYGATSEEALPLRAGYFMHWKIIGWLGENTEAEWYDLGGTDGFQGLHQFKKGMVGAEGLISEMPPVQNYASHFSAMALGTSAFWARDTIQKVKRRLNQLRADMARPDQDR